MEKILIFFKQLIVTKYFSWMDSIKIGGTQKQELYLHKSKIVIQAIRNLSLERRIVASIDEEGIYYIGTVNGLTPYNSPDDFIRNEYYLLALINSDLLNFYFKNQYTTISLTAAFLGELPIRYANEDTQNELGDLVSELLTLTDSKVREKKIRELNTKIYQLYDLTKEEILFIENNKSNKNNV